MVVGGESRPDRKAHIYVGFFFALKSKNSL